MIKKMIYGIMAISLLAISCNDDDDNASATANLQIDISGLENLGDDYVYEGWIIVNDSPVSTGIFTVNDNGLLSKTSFEINRAQLELATAFVLSIEPVNDSDPAPAVTKIMNGSFSGNTANIATGILGDFANVSGTFFLRTPTDETSGNNGNDENGIWFGTPGMPPTANLNLPVLPSGWVYEGWVVVEGAGPLTTGTFTDFEAADALAPFSGTNPGPPVPGEDFFNNAPAGFTFPLDVRNRTVVISIEPVPDNSPAPFLLKPLVGNAGTETAPATHNLSENLGSLPTGTVSR